MVDRDTRLKRLRFRAWHRGTKEADLIVGHFFDAHHDAWDDDAIAWFERLMDEQDVDIIAWTIQSCGIPAHIDGPMIRAMQRLDYVPSA